MKMLADYGHGVSHRCPGCGHNHYIRITGPQPVWSFNGDYDKPTLSPSVRHFWPAHEDKPERTICHYFITNGKIAYCSDCAHALAGQTVDLPDYLTPLPSGSTVARIDEHHPPTGRNEMTTIVPTVGRVMLYHPASNEQIMAADLQPLAALVAKVTHEGTRVNLMVIDENGQPVPNGRQNVPVVQDGEPKPDGGGFATWMAYQVGQAVKTEELQAQLAQHDANAEFAKDTATAGQSSQAAQAGDERP